MVPSTSKALSWSPSTKGEKAGESSESYRGRSKIRSVDFCCGKGLLVELGVISPLFLPMCAETCLPHGLQGFGILAPCLSLSYLIIYLESTRLPLAEGRT